MGRGFTVASGSRLRVDGSTVARGVAFGLAYQASLVRFRFHGFAERGG